MVDTNDQGCSVTDVQKKWDSIRDAEFEYTKHVFDLACLATRTAARADELRAALECIRERLWAHLVESTEEQHEEESPWLSPLITMVNRALWETNRPSPNASLKS